MHFGQIEYFVIFEDSIEKYAYVTLLYPVRYGLSDDSDLKFENFVQVLSTEQTQWVNVSEMKKVALIENKTEKWLVFVPKFVDHK